MSSLTGIKIFVDGHSFDKEFQGTRTFIRELYHEMCGQAPGTEFYIGANNIETLKKEFSSLTNIHFVRYKSSSAMARLNRDIPQIIKKYGIHFAHFQYIAPFRKHCRYIVTTHDILFNDFKSEFSLSYRLVRNFLFKYGIKRADIKTTVSRYSLDRISHYYNIPASEIHVIKNGVSDVFFEDYNKQDEEAFIQQKYGIGPYVLYVSRLEPRKNHLLLLKAFIDKKLYQNDLNLVLIGKSSIVDAEFEQTVHSMPVAAKSHFFRIEQVDNDSLLKFYRAAKLFVYPSKAEGFGIPPLEAAAMKIPVLCSDKTAMSDFTFFNDRFFDPLNQQEFEYKLTAMLSAKEDTVKNQAISDAIKQQYSWQSSAKTLLSLVNNHVTDQPI